MSDIAPIKSRLLTFIKHQGLSVRAFEMACGLSNGFVNNMVRGIGAERLENILQTYPELSRVWLLTGEGEMLRYRPEDSTPRPSEHPMNLSERMQAIVDYSGLSARALSDKLGLKTSQSLYDLLKGNTRSVSRRVQDAIFSAYPEINPLWLLMGEGEMLRGDDYPESEVEPALETKLRLVPKYSMDVVATFVPDGAAQEEYVEELVPWPSAKADDFCLSVVGRSMEPRIPEGSLVLCRPFEGDVDDVEFGRVHVIVTNDDRAMLKVVRLDKENPDCLLLESFNPDFPTRRLKVADVRRLFIVVAATTFY